MTEPRVPQMVANRHESDARKAGRDEYRSEVVKALRELNGPHDEEWIVEKVDLCNRLGIDPEELEYD